MSGAALSVALAAGIGGLAVALNHLQARIGLIELALNDGLPPGYERSLRTPATASFSAERAQRVLDDGVHVFLSRTCVACQRLLDEIDRRGFELQPRVAIELHYVDRPRPRAREVAARLGAELHEREHDAVKEIGIDPLPHTVAIGAHGLVAHGVSPTIDDARAVARNAGIVA